MATLTVSRVKYGFGLPSQQSLSFLCTDASYYGDNNTNYINNKITLTRFIVGPIDSAADNASLPRQRFDRLQSTL